IGVAALGATVVGYVPGGSIGALERFALGVSSLLLIIPGTTTDIVGLVVIAAVFARKIRGHNT
ncbi:MAG TPA: hypothetical protein PLW40_12460, partial [Syntrophales bacterium]|nr:hypothetical protein [Syntrophales bacterium]